MSDNGRKGLHNAFVSMMHGLQLRLTDGTGRIPVKAEDLCKALINELLRASRNDVIVNAQNDIRHLIQMTDGKPKTGPVYEVACGPKEWKRPETVNPKVHLLREDAALIQFHLEVEELPDRLRLLSYSMEMWLPVGGVLPFVRLHLNPPSRENADSGMRAHVHPGHDDIRLPTPILSPAEALSFLLYDCALPPAA